MSNFKSVRLSKESRANIKKAMCDQWTTTNFPTQSLIKIENAIADSIWFNLYQDIAKHINKIPDEMLQLRISIKVSVAGNVREFKLSKPHPVLSNGYWDQKIAAAFNVPTPDMDRLEELEQRFTKAREDLKLFSEEVSTILDAVTTTAQLVDLWPEAEQYLPPSVASPSLGIKLPALSTSRLNTALGIK